jgi:hypothetical protein
LVRWVRRAALVLMTVIAMSGCLAGPKTPDLSPAPAATGSEHPVGGSGMPIPLECAGPPKHAVEGAPVVPAEAVAARLCGGQVDNAGFNLVWPADTLYGREVRRLVVQLNRLKPYVQPTSCTLVLSPGFDLVLMYPDGSRVWVNGETSGTCEHVTVHGGREWVGAPRVLRSTLNLIKTRRATDGPAAVTTDVACPRRWNDVSFTAGATRLRPGTPDTKAVVAIACRYRLHLDPRYITQSAAGGLVEQARVNDPATLVRAVGDGSRTDPCGGVDYDLNPIQDVILVQDRYGDTQVVSTAPCWANELTGQRRYPSRSLAERVARLLS